MAVDFSGKWTLESSDDQYAAYVEAIGKYSAVPL